MTKAKTPGSAPTAAVRSAVDVLREVETVNAAASLAEQALAEACEAAMRAVLKPGDVLDLRVRKGLPEYLWGVRTMRGNDRGTKLFRVAEAPTVRVDLASPPMSFWVCEMVPVSETTGRDMSGSTHGANGSGFNTVQLRGYVVDPNLSAMLDDGAMPSDMERLATFLDRSRGLTA